MKINYLEKFDKFAFLAWICIWIILTIQFANNASIQEAVSFSFATVLVFYPFTTFLSKRLLKSAVKKKTMLRFIFQFLLISMVMIGLVLCLYVLFAYLEDIHLFPKSQLFYDSEDNIHNSIGALAAVVLINFGFCGIRFFEENLRLHKIIIDSQLQILQAQINPHFMFNVLNHVNVLIKKEPDLASSLLVQYTGILRYQLYNGKRDFIRIRQEVDFLKDFIEIEKIRWKNNLIVECRWEIEDDDAEFPPLLLITFIENAFKHVSRSKTEKGYVKILLKQENKMIRLYVENSKFADGFDKVKNESSGLGLENIKRRLEILFPGKYSLTINQTETVYTTTFELYN